MAGGQKNNRACGSRYELELVNYFKSRGLKAHKHAMSGSLDEKGDLTVVTGWDEDWVGEAKWRKELPKWFVECLGDHKFAAFREARGETFVMIRLNDFADLIQCK